MKKRLPAFIPIIIIAVLAVIGILLFSGIIWFNNPSQKEYPVRGVDVSAYQGLIDWKVLASQSISFAFIKATEGSGSQDENFTYNWVNANKTTLKVGAYHFFSFESPGSTQADNYIKSVPKLFGSMPPAVDLEFYGNYSDRPPAKAKIDKELGDMLKELEAHYGKKPVVYATEQCYDLYLKDTFKNNPIWIRNIYTKAKLSDDRKWTFWQYSNHQLLKGYRGEERFIDMNVFNGTKQEFTSLCEPMNQ